jgi:hypothetical protein
MSDEQVEEDPPPPTLEELKKAVMPFDPPDTLWQALKLWRNHAHRRAYWRWLRYGPDRELDRRYFEAQWAEADTEDDKQYVELTYTDMRTQRRESLVHLKSDVQTFFVQVGLLLVVAGTSLGLVDLQKLQDFLGSPARHLFWLLLASWVLAATAHSHKLLYTLYTHFEGAAERAHKVTGQPSYVDGVRKEVNRLSIVLQRGRRLFDLSRIILFAMLITMTAIMMW